MSATSVLADAPKNTGPDFGKASPVGLLIVVLLLLGVFALVWSMNRHLKKVPASFDGEPADQPPEAGPALDSGAGPAEGDTAAGSAPEKTPREPGG